MNLYYSGRRCPKCGVDLTQDESVVVEFVDDVGQRLPQKTSKLQRDGSLVDVGGMVAEGFHSKSKCGSCGEDLKKQESGFRN